MLTDFQNFCCTYCDKLIAPLCNENISSRCKQLQTICEKPLSEGSKQTFSSQIKVSSHGTFSFKARSILAWLKTLTYPPFFEILSIKSDVSKDCRVPSSSSLPPSQQVQLPDLNQVSYSHVAVTNNQSQVSHCHKI